MKRDRGVKDKGGEMGGGRDLFIGPENVRTEFYLPASPQPPHWTSLRDQHFGFFATSFSWLFPADY